jgi:hypothetical protein
MHPPAAIERGVDCSLTVVYANNNLGFLHPRRRCLRSKYLGLDQLPGMEVASLAIGVAALYTTCRDCYQFFTSVKTAGPESSSHLRELEIQQSILKAWGMHWQIQQTEESKPQDHNHTGRRDTKLHKYFVRNPHKADGVFKTLSALADTLSDQNKLTKRYGIQLRQGHAIHDVPDLTNNVLLAIVDKTIKDVSPVISEVRSRLSTLNKLKWALKDRVSFTRLISDLKSHGDSLYRLCPENAFESINIYVTMDCLAGQEVPEDLKSFSQLAIEQAEDSEDASTGDRYRLLASFADLKARINENRDEERPDEASMSTIDEQEQSQIVSLGEGLALYKREVVFVEIRDYRGPPSEPTLEQKRKHPYGSVRLPDPRLRTLIKNFYSTFHGANTGGSVCGLDILGMIDHSRGKEQGHCSILYRLPGNIGSLSGERPAENLHLRAPMDLASLWDFRGTGIKSNLGARFELARKLVRAVCLLHSTGWLHKNIRAESVMFFPEHSSAFRRDKHEDNIEIDVSQPILMGYLFSRPDGITVPGPKPPPGQDQGTRPAFVMPSTPNSPSNNILNGSTLDYYQHPARHANPERLYRHAYDVYSLGILLLEVGLWRRLCSDDGIVPDPRLQQGLSPLQDDRSQSGYSTGYSGLPIRTHSQYGYLPQHSYPQAPPAPSRPGYLPQHNYSQESPALSGYGHPPQHSYPQAPPAPSRTCYRPQHSYPQAPPAPYHHGYPVQHDYPLQHVYPTQRIRSLPPSHSRNPSRLVEDHYERRRWICTTYLDHLRWSCGDVYANVVLSCLMVDSSDDEVAKASQRELCARIVADLEGCRA